MAIDKWQYVHWAVFLTVYLTPAFLISGPLPSSMLSKASFAYTLLLACKSLSLSLYLLVAFPIPFKVSFPPLQSLPATPEQMILFSSGFFKPFVMPSFRTLRTECFTYVCPSHQTFGFQMLLFKTNSYLSKNWTWEKGHKKRGLKAVLAKTYVARCLFHRPEATLRVRHVTA